jgi:hypothetical protein
MADEQKQELSVREKARLDRLARVQQEQNQGRVRVVPRDDMRAILKHPIGDIGFPATGGAEWPDDAFTRRRIEDGSVTLEQASSKRERTPPSGSAPAA